VVLGGEEEGGGVRSGPGEARTILRFHIISARPSKQPLMVRTFLQVYMELAPILFLQEEIKDIIILVMLSTRVGSRACGGPCDMSAMPSHESPRVNSTAYLCVCEASVRALTCDVCVPRCVSTQAHCTRSARI
jgi:hypothetical protein